MLILDTSNSTIVDGHIVEQGTYQQLADTNGAFALLMRDFGGAKEDTDEKLAGQEEEAIESIAKATVGQDQQQSQREAAYDKSAAKLAAGTGKFEGRLMQQEKRSTGSIGWKVYRAYLSSAKGWITVPLVIASSVLMQGGFINAARDTSTLSCSHRRSSDVRSVVDILGE